MGAILRVLAVVDGKRHDDVVAMNNIDTVSCEFNDSKPDDNINQVGSKGRIRICTKYGNNIDFQTSVEGKVRAIFADPSYDKLYAFNGIDGALIMHTAYCMHFDNEKIFSQYVLGKGGYVSSNDDASDQKSEES